MLYPSILSNILFQRNYLCYIPSFLFFFLLRRFFKLPIKSLLPSSPIPGAMNWYYIIGKIKVNEPTQFDRLGTTSLQVTLINNVVCWPFHFIDIAFTLNWGPHRKVRQLCLQGRYYRLTPEFVVSGGSAGTTFVVQLSLPVICVVSSNTTLFPVSETNKKS